MIRFSPFTQGVVNVDPETFEVVNRNKVRQIGADAAGGPAAQAVLGAVADGFWYEIVGIFSSFQMSGVAAARTCELQISTVLQFPNDVRGAAQPQENVDLAIVLAADEQGFIWMNGRNFITQDTNGVVADTAALESLLPFILPGGSIIQSDITANVDAGDVYGINVLYKRVD